MSDNNERLFTKLDIIQDDVSEIKVTLARNTTSLEAHMLRTALAEENLNILKQEVIDQNLKLNHHISMVKGAAWVLSAMGALLMSLHSMGIIKL